MSSEASWACPFCGSIETERLAAFGQFLLSEQHYCRACRSAFDVVRWVDESPPPDGPAGGGPDAG